jgi:hypothetical protein
LLFHFGNFVLDPQRRELRSGAKVLAVEPQVSDVLVYLIKHRDRVVSRDDLLADVWGGRIVSESTLSRRINSARAAIGDSGERQEWRDGPTMRRASIAVPSTSIRTSRPRIGYLGWVLVLMDNPTKRSRIFSRR